MQKVAILLFAIIGAAFGRAVQDAGPCPAVQGKKNFNLNAFMGQWYVQARHPSTLSRCTIESFAVNRNATLSIVSRGIDAAGSVAEIRGIANLDDDINSGEFTVSFTNTDTEEVLFYVLDTDYCSFATVYSCSQSGRQHSRLVILLTRAQNPDVTVLDQAQAALSAQNIPDEVSPVSQKNC